MAVTNPAVAAQPIAWPIVELSASPVVEPSASPVTAVGPAAGASAAQPVTVEKAADGKAADEVFAALVEKAAPAVVAAPPPQAASIALAAGLKNLLRPTQASPATTAASGASDKSNASAAGTEAPSRTAPGQPDTVEAASPAPTPTPTPTPKSIPADAAVTATSPSGGTITPPTDGKVETAALAADTGPAGASPTAAAAPPVAGQTPSVTPGLSASLSSLSQATIETTAQIAAQITRQLNGRATRFEMGLTPEGLGRVDVRLDIDADGRLTAQLAFDNPLAATDLRGRADELRSQLQDAGFKLSQDALSFSQRDPSGGSTGEGGADPRQSRAFAAASRVESDADAAPAASPWISLSLTPRGVDMKV